MVQRRDGQLGDDVRAAQGHGAAAPDQHVPHDAHVLVRRRLRPVDPAHREVLERVVRVDLERHAVHARAHLGGHVEVVPGVGAVDLVLGGDPGAVDPHVGLGQHAAEVQVGALRGAVEGQVGAVPPGDGEVRLRHVAHPRRVERVGVDVVRQQGRVDRRTRRRRVPASGREARLGHRGVVADPRGRPDEVAGDRRRGPGGVGPAVDAAADRSPDASGATTAAQTSETRAVTRTVRRGSRGRTRRLLTSAPPRAHGGGRTRDLLGNFPNSPWIVAAPRPPRQPRTGARRQRPAGADPVTR